MTTPEPLKLYVASRNEGKRRELLRLLDGLGVEIVGPNRYEHITDVIEDEPTFAGNAIKKALAAAKRTGLPVIADDSGLEVDALEGAPGVHSARYAHLDATDMVGSALGNADDEANNARLLEALDRVPDEERTARFRCVIAFVDLQSPQGPQGQHGQQPILFEGSCEGRITREPAGEDGFGYDPLFFVPLFGKTYAELTIDEKNRVSHRAHATRALCEYLRSYLPRRLALMNR